MPAFLLTTLFRVIYLCHSEEVTFVICFRQDDYRFFQALELVCSQGLMGAMIPLSHSVRSLVKALKQCRTIRHCFIDVFS